MPTWTTAGRPTNPQSGQMGYNSTLGYIEWYAGINGWTPIYSPSGLYVDYLIVAGGGGFQGSVSGYTSGGYISGRVNTIDKFSFTADGNATDVADLTQGRYSVAGQQG